tara:strand:- start:1234 stop:1431 length:198 start_codon:yes stop_codon:yes gene_type:complete
LGITRGAFGVRLHRARLARKNLLPGRLHKLRRAWLQRLCLRPRQDEKAGQFEHGLKFEALSSSNR